MTDILAHLREQFAHMFPTAAAPAPVSRAGSHFYGVNAQADALFVSGKSRGRHNCCAEEQRDERSSSATCRGSAPATPPFPAAATQKEAAETAQRGGGSHNEAQ